MHAKSIIIYTVQCRDRVCYVVSEDHGQNYYLRGDRQEKAQITQTTAEKKSVISLGE